MLSQFSVRRGRSRRVISAVRVGFFRTGLGLMFRTRYTSNLLFSFRTSSRVAITSWFVFFPFLAVWLDSHYRVIETRIVYPFTLSLRPRLPASFLLEVPCTSRTATLRRFLVGK